MIILLWDEPMNKVKIEKNIKYKRADNKVVNPEHRPLNIDYDRYVTIKNDLRKKNIIQKKFSILHFLMLLILDLILYFLKQIKI